MLTRITVLVLLVAATAGLAQAPPPSPMFRFEANSFWLNLHHFLYVLGRAQNKTADSSREAVAAAPTEAAAGLAKLSLGEQQVWADVVTAYAGSLSQKTSILEPPLPATALALARVRDAATVKDAAIERSTRELLERAAPIYRTAWWNEHRARHQTYQATLQGQLDRHGRAIHDFITRSYGIAWPAAGFPVHFVAYANFQGNFSVGAAGESLLVMSTNSNPANQGLFPLEIVFHEGMHQWDSAVRAAMLAQARNVKAIVPVDLSHALIFVTSGEAVRRVDPAHVPYIDAFALWPLRLSGSTIPAQRLKAPIEDIWKPYLDGRGTRDAAFAALLTRVGGPAR